MKKIILVLVVIIGGGGYYYLGIYQPEQFGRNFLNVVDEMGKKYQSQISLPLSEGSEIEKAKALLLRQEEGFVDFKNKISSLKPPYLGELSSLKSNMLLFLDKYLLALTDAKVKLSFLEKASLLKISLEFRNAPDPYKTRVEDLVKYYETKTEEMKSLAQDFFSQTPPSGLKSTPTFEELKVMWRDVLPGFDIVLNFYRAKQPGLVADRLSEKDFSRNEQAILDKFPEFRRKFDDFVRTGNLSNYASPSLNDLGKDDSELKVMNEKINNAINDLRIKYK